jgi:hypothetical protein
VVVVVVVVVVRKGAESWLISAAAEQSKRRWDAAFSRGRWRRVTRCSQSGDGYRRRKKK